jgi:hypothetical protein
LDEQASIQNELLHLERLQRKQRQEIFDVEDEIVARRDALINELQQRLQQSTQSDTLYTIRWKVL